MSETYSVYNQNGTLANELARCRVVKISTGVYTWDIVGGSASSTSEESIVADDNYSIIRAEIPSAERAGVPIEWAVNSAKDFYVVAICEEGIIDGLSDGAFSYDAEQKVLWLECPFENAKEWIAYIFRAEHPVNNFAIAEGRARISAIQAQFEKDNRILRQLDAQIFRTLRTCDPIKTLPPKEKLIGKVLAFGEDGNPDLSLSKGDVEGAYLARDEAKELKNETETLKNQTAELKLDAESYKNYAIDAASKALAAQGKAEEAQVAAEKAKADTGNLKSDVEATVSEFNATVNSKVQEVETAGEKAVSEVNTAKADAKTEIAAASDSALDDIEQKGASYQAGISVNSAVLTGAVSTSEETKMLPFVNYSTGADYFNGKFPKRTEGKYTAMSHYYPISGDWTLFKESSDMDSYGNGVCVKIFEGGKKLAYFEENANGETIYSYAVLEKAFVEGDAVAAAYNAGNLKVYRNKELVLDKNIEDESYLSGNFGYLIDVLLGVNWKKDFIFANGQAMELAGGVYSISDFVDGIKPSTPALTKHDSVNAPFTDATGLTLGYTTGTYNQTVDGLTCAKFVPTVHATTKRVRYVTGKAPYAIENNSVAHVRFKFKLPASNVNWKYVYIQMLGSYLTYKETTSVLDANSCAAASDEWQTVEFDIENGNYIATPRFYLRGDSGTDTTSTAAGQVITTSDSDAFYLAEYSIEYAEPITCYVEAPTKNNVFIQKGVMPLNLCLERGVSSATPLDIVSIGNIGANLTISKTATFNLLDSMVLDNSTFNYLPFGACILRAIAIKPKSTSTITNTNEFTFTGTIPSFSIPKFTKADLKDGMWYFEASYPSVVNLNLGAGVYAYFALDDSEDMGDLQGEIWFFWEQVNKA